MVTYLIGIFLCIKLTINTVFLSFYNKIEKPTAFKISLLQMTLFVIALFALGIPIILLRFITNGSLHIPLGIEKSSWWTLLVTLKSIFADAFSQKQASAWYKKDLSIKGILLITFISLFCAIIITGFILGLYKALFIKLA